MTLVLSEHLPLLASAPDGIQKLRSLILELAMRGKLLPQDSKDEPASKLLQRINKERTQLEAAGVCRKSKPTPLVGHDEQAFVLPSGWEWIRLGQIGDWGAGATPLRSNPRYYGGTIPWFKSGELTSDFISESEEHVTELALKECSLRQNKVGDVLIAMYGATIGKTAILATEATTNQAVCACTPNTGVFNRYLLFLLKALKSNFVGQGAGGAQPNISREKIIATVTALPPEPEQHRIVAKVDELMALCDRLEAEQADSASAHARLVETLLGTLAQSTDAAELAANWQRLAKHFDALFNTEASIDALKQTILQLAVMGKLVPQDPNDEPVSESLAEISVPRASNSSPVDETGPIAQAMITLPTSWRWSSVERLTKPGQTTTYGILKPVWVNGGVPTVRVTEMKTGTIDIHNLPTCDPGRASSFGKTTLQAHDLLVSKDGTIGKTAFVPPALVGGNITQHVLRFPITDQVNRFFVRMAIDSPTCQAWMAGETKGVALKGVNVGDFRRMPIPLPPLGEQNQIVAKVDELMSLCDQIKADLATTRRRQSGLADTLIDSALEAA